MENTSGCNSSGEKCQSGAQSLITKLTCQVHNVWLRTIKCIKVTYVTLSHMTVSFVSATSLFRRSYESTAIVL